jgi:hypothetical protein
LDVEAAEWRGRRCIAVRRARRPVACVGCSFG